VVVAVLVASIQDMCSGYGVFAVAFRSTQVLAFERWPVHVRFSI